MRVFELSEINNDVEFYTLFKEIINYIVIKLKNGDAAFPTDASKKLNDFSFPAKFLSVEQLLQALENEKSSLNEGDLNQKTIISALLLTLVKVLEKNTGEKPINLLKSNSKIKNLFDNLKKDIKGIESLLNEYSASLKLGFAVIANHHLSSKEKKTLKEVSKSSNKKFDKYKKNNVIEICKNIAIELANQIQAHHGSLNIQNSVKNQGLSTVTQGIFGISPRNNETVLAKKNGDIGLEKIPFHEALKKIHFAITRLEAGFSLSTSNSKKVKEIKEIFKEILIETSELLNKDNLKDFEIYEVLIKVSDKVDLILRDAIREPNTITNGIKPFLNEIVSLFDEVIPPIPKSLLVAKKDEIKSVKIFNEVIKKPDIEFGQYFKTIVIINELRSKKASEQEIAPHVEQMKNNKWHSKLEKFNIDNLGGNEIPTFKITCSEVDPKSKEKSFILKLPGIVSTCTASLSYYNKNANTAFLSQKELHTSLRPKIYFSSSVRGTKEEDYFLIILSECLPDNLAAESQRLIKNKYKKNKFDKKEFDQYVLQRFAQLLKIYSTMNSHNLHFLDGKLPNYYLTSKSKIKLADAKSFVSFSSNKVDSGKYELRCTPGFVFSEVGNCIIDIIKLQKETVCTSIFAYALDLGSFELNALRKPPSLHFFEKLEQKISHLSLLDKLHEGKKNEFILGFKKCIEGLKDSIFSLEEGLERIDRVLSSEVFENSNEYLKSVMKKVGRSYEDHLLLKTVSFLKKHHPSGLNDFKKYCTDLEMFKTDLSGKKLTFEQALLNVSKETKKHILSNLSKVPGTWLKELRLTLQEEKTKYAKKLYNAISSKLDNLDTNNDHVKLSLIIAKNLLIDPVKPRYFKNDIIKFLEDFFQNDIETKNQIVQIAQPIMLDIESSYTDDMKNNFIDLASKLEVFSGKDGLFIQKQMNSLLNSNYSFSSAKIRVHTRIADNKLKAESKEEIPGELESSNLS